MNPQGAFAFLLGFVIDLYIFLVLTRFLLQLVRADFYNPVSQFIVKATNPVLLPLRRAIPGFGGVDVASLVLVFALILIKLVLITLLFTGSFSADPLQVVIVLVREIARLMLSYLFWAILIRIILSWVSPDPYNPLVQIVGQLTEPVMAPARKLLPPMGGLDLSPMLVMVGIYFLQVLLGLKPF